MTPTPLGAYAADHGEYDIVESRASTYRRSAAIGLLVSRTLEPTRAIPAATAAMIAASTRGNSDRTGVTRISLVGYERT
jgi:hypothetical protein